jgi:hypothetical protein
MSELTYEIVSRRLTDIQRDRAQDSKALGMRGWRETERKKRARHCGRPSFGNPSERPSFPPVR